MDSYIFCGTPMKTAQLVYKMPYKDCNFHEVLFASIFEGNIIYSIVRHENMGVHVIKFEIDSERLRQFTGS